MKWTWLKAPSLFYLGIITLLLSALSACQGIPPDNPYDPQAPELVQAPGQVLGELFTSEPGGDLRGGVVYLSGSSQSAVVECLTDTEEPEGEEGAGVCQRARFSFGAVPPGAYEVRLSAPCFSAQPFAAFEVGIGDVIDLSAQPADEGEEARREAISVRYARGLVRGQVSGPESQFLERVRLSDARGALASPDAEGRFLVEMAACEGQLNASLEGYRSASSSTLNVPVSAELELGEPLYLEPIPAMVVGTLETSTGEPLPEEGVTLTLTRVSADSPDEDIVQQVTGAQVSIEEVPAGAWRLTVSHPSFQTIEQRLELSAAPRGVEDAYQLGVLRLSPSMGSLKGQVSLAIANPELPIYVELLEGPSAGLQQQASSSGAYQFSLIRGGSYRVSARAYGYQSATLEELVTVTGDDEVSAPELSLALNPGQVRGAVEWDPSLTGVTFMLSLSGEVTQTRDDQRCTEGVDCLEGATCDAGACLQPRGFFQFDAVPAGDYSLSVSPPTDAGLRALTRPNVRVEPGALTTVEGLSVELATGSLQGSVSLEGDGSLSGVLIQLTHLASGEEHITLTDVSGAWRATDLRVGAYQVTISAPDYQTETQSAEVLEGQALSVDQALLYDRGCVQGQLEMTDGSEEYEQVSVTLLETISVTAGDAQGRFQFDELIPGGYTVTASRAGYQEASVVFTVLAGQACETSTLSLTLIDQQPPSAPRVRLTEDYPYTPIAGADLSPAILRASWDEVGRDLVELELVEDESSPLEHRNFDPEAGLGGWGVKVNGRGPFRVYRAQDHPEELITYRRLNGRTVFSVRLTLFDIEHDSGLIESPTLLSLLGAGTLSSLAGDAEIISALESALPPEGSIDRQDRLAQLPTPSFELEFIARDSEDNHSDTVPFELRLDVNPPNSGRLLQPQECNPISTDRTFAGGPLEGCITNRETLSLRLSSPSSDVACVYALDLHPNQAEQVDLVALSEAPLDQTFTELDLSADCLNPNSAHLVSANEQAEGFRVRCLLPVDASGRLAISTHPTRGPEEFCAAIRRDITPPARFSVTPHLTRVRGRWVNLSIDPLVNDLSLDHYEIKNVTRGSAYQEVSLSESTGFSSPELTQGVRNELHVKAVDQAGNESEVVTVELWEESVQALDDGSGGYISNLEALGDQRAWLSSLSCTLDGEDGAAQLSGRGCHAALVTKHGDEEASAPLLHPRLVTMGVVDGPLVVSNTTPELGVQMSAVGRLDDLRLEITVGGRLPSGMELSLIPPSTPTVVNPDPIPITSPTLSTDGIIMVNLDREPTLEERLLGEGTSGEWRVRFTFSSPSDALTVSRLRLELTLAEEEVTRCVIACDQLNAQHTGRGLDTFQTHLSDGGLLITQFTELENSQKYHQARLWAMGADDKLGTADDYEVHLDDGADPSLPIIALAGSADRLVYVRAGDDRPSGTLPPSFTINSFQRENGRDFGTLPLREEQLAHKETLYESASLRSITLIDQLLWVMYTDYSGARPGVDYNDPSEGVDRLDLIYLDRDAEQPNTRLSVRFGGEASSSDPVTAQRVISGNLAPLVLFNYDRRLLLKRLPAMTQLSALFGDSPADDGCSCDSATAPNVICFGDSVSRAEYCLEPDKGGYSFQSLRDPSAHDCTAPDPESNIMPVCGELISIASSGDQLIFHTRGDTDPPYQLLKAFVLDSPSRQPEPFYLSDSPLKAVSLNSDLVSFLSSSRASSTPYTLYSHTQMITDLAVEGPRQNLKAGANLFLDRRGAELYVTSKRFGQASQPLQLPEPLTFGDGVMRAVTSDLTTLNGELVGSWAEGRGFTVVSSDLSPNAQLPSDVLYVIVRGEGSQERALIRARVTTSTVNQPFNWEVLTYFNGPVHDLKATFIKNSNFFVSVAPEQVYRDRSLESVQGPYLLFDSSISSASTITQFTLSDLGLDLSSLPAEACERLAVTEVNTRLFVVCASQAPGQPVTLSMAKLTPPSYSAPPLEDQVTLTSASEIMPLLLDSPSFSSPADAAQRLSVYQLHHLALNTEGALLLELRDDEVGRLYLSQDVFSLRKESFKQVYARLSRDKSPTLLTTDALIFSDELETQEPEVLKLSLSSRRLERLSADNSPQYSPARYGQSVYWLDERYVTSDAEPVGTLITEQCSAMSCLCLTLDCFKDRQGR